MLFIWGEAAHVSQLETVACMFQWAAYSWWFLLKKKSAFHREKSTSPSLFSAKLSKLTLEPGMAPFWMPFYTHAHLNALHNVATVQLELLQQAGSFTCFMNSAAPMLHAPAPWLHRLQLLQLILPVPNCVSFSCACCSIVSASAATLWLCLLQLLLPCYFCFSWCSQIASSFNHPHTST